LLPKTGKGISGPAEKLTMETSSGPLAKDTMMLTGPILEVPSVLNQTTEKAMNFVWQFSTIFMPMGSGFTMCLATIKSLLFARREPKL